MDLITEKIKNLLREVKTIKAYSTRVEEQLTELMGGVGTAQKAQTRKQEREEELRMRIKERFTNPRARLTDKPKTKKQTSKTNTR